jgi:hypothetical protein
MKTSFSQSFVWNSAKLTLETAANLEMKTSRIFPHAQLKGYNGT